ncbi:MAG: hypothetical protein QNJ65_19785 [Xenococcaceae cyanobacterium MO_234.B1]|nr:hypothetical protein [Xenococcaceae cyanobacterium MO_234.B1]
MTVRQPRYSKEEFARRGDEIYESQVRSQVEEGNHGKIVAIDIETGEWEMDASEIVAASRLEKRLPDAQIWIARVGSRYVRRFGAGRIQKPQ